MNLRTSSLFFLTLLSGAANILCAGCEESSQECMYPESACDWQLELRTAYFYPSSSLERNIYSGARFDVEAELSKSICQNWDLWANFTYFSKRGKSEGLGLDTRLTLYPLSIGISYVYPICSSALSLYAGIGLNYTWLHIHDDAGIGSSKTNRGRLGATVKSGAYYQINDMFFADLFVDYLYMPMHLTNAYNVGGFRFGVGLGTSF